MAKLRLDRTLCFVKEPRKQRDGGGFRLKRIPWDLISAEGYGFLVSPMPVQIKADQRTQTAAYIKNLDDLIYNELSDGNEIDPIVGFAFFSSESEFYAKFEGSFGMYKTSGNAGDVSSEFGYPKK